VGIEKATQQKDSQWN